MAEDPEKFFPGMPSVSYDNPEYRSGAYWRGPAWVNISFFAFKGLRDYGYRDLAEKLKSNLLGWMAKNPDSLYEYYDSRSGQGLGAHAYGWTAAFALSFVFDWNNDDLTWLFQRV